MADVRLNAAKLLASILKQQGSLSSLLPNASAEVDERDRPLLQELCYGVCRWQPRLNTYLQQLLQKPLRSKDSDVQALLLMGLYQLIFMRIPDHAALNATVEIAQKLKKPWAKKLINGVLRGFIRQRQELDETLGAQTEFKTGHPAWLVTEFEKAWPKHYPDIIAANNEPPPFTLRVNQQQFSRDQYKLLLDQNNITATNTPFSSVGLCLEKAVGVNQLPQFETGAVSVQDEAPQLCADLLNCHSDHRVLDACSAPGGKTAHLLECFPQLTMVAVDISEPRLQRTGETLARLQLSAKLIAGDACEPSGWWDKQAFDRILVDAPCSATGIIRRQPDIKILRNTESIAKLVSIQFQMLKALWPLLKNGGELLYATCSVLPSENVEQISAFLESHSDAEHIAIDADWGIAQTVGRQCLPQVRGHDGFYFARLRKRL